MSAVVVIRQADRVHMITDGAGLHEGKLIARVVKSLPIPHLNLVVGTRGKGLVSSVALMALSEAGATYDEAKRNAGDVIRRYASIPGMPTDGFEVYVAGISESTGPDAWGLSTNEKSFDSAPFEVVDIPRLAIAPDVSPTRIELLRDLQGPNALDYVGELMDDLRTTQAPLASRPGALGMRYTERGYTVGCFAQLTTVTVEGISSRIIRRWPDEIGNVLKCC